MQGFSIDAVDKQPAPALRDGQQIGTRGDDEGLSGEQYAVLVHQMERQRLSYADRVDVNRDQIHGCADYACVVFINEKAC